MGLQNQAESLLKDAKRGLTRSYIELCKIYYREVFQLVLQFHADVNHAKNITIEVFIKGRRNLSNIKEDENFYSWIQRIVIVVVLYHLKMEEEFRKQKLENDESFPSLLNNSNLTHIETEFAKLSDKERIILTLFFKLDFNVVDIAPIIGETNIKTESLIGELLSKFIEYSDNRTLKNASSENVKFLVVAEELTYLKRSDAENKLLESFQEFKSELKEIFSNVKADAEIVSRIKDSLVTEKAPRKKTVTKQLSKKEKKKLRIEEEIEKDREKVIVNTDLSKAFELHLWELEKKTISDRIKTALAYLAIPVLAAGIIFYLVHLNKYNTPWDVERIRGQVLIDNSVSINKLNEGDIVETERDSETRIIIPDCGSFTMLDNSSLELIKGYDRDNVVSLLSGKIKFNSITKIDKEGLFTEKQDLTIITEMGRIKSEYGVFQLEVEDNELAIRVNDGWIEYYSNNNTIYLGSGYIFKIAHDKKLIAPHFINSYKQYVGALYEYEIPPIDIVPISSAIGESEEIDVLTLWHLLSKVDQVERKLIVDKIDSLYPVLTEEIKDGLIELNEEAMIFMLNFIKWQMLISTDK